MNFTISLFENVGDSRPLVKACTWAGFCKGVAAPKVRADKDGQLFSPARLSGNRRLQSNVIDLSMLVLEIDGAWRCDCCGHAGPHNLFVSNRVKTADGRVNRSPRCPACLKAKCAKCFRKEPKPHTKTTITNLNVSFKSIVEGMRRVFPNSAFAVYSTHSHMRETAVKCDGTNAVCAKCVDSTGDPCGAVYGHEHAERCVRLVVPLASPVPVAEFSSLWTRAVNSLAEYDVIVDPQAKDPNRIFYTPVKFSNEAPYEFHVEPGEFFDWQSALGTQDSGLRNDVTLKLSEQFNDKSTEHVGQSAQPSEHQAESSVLSPGDFQTHEERHAELCRRIASRGKLNSRGHYDAKGLCHNGRGATGICYFPDSGAVQCNAGCDYFLDILPADGLPNHHLPSEERLARDAARNALREPGARGQGPAVSDSRLPTPDSVLLPRRADGVLTVPYLHVIYSSFLAHFCELSSEHEALIRKHWGVDPLATGEFEAVPYFTDDTRDARPVKMASMPNNLQKVIAANELSRWFDLNGVPGFYREVNSKLPAAPGTDAALIRAVTREWGDWRINLPFKGLLAPYCDEAGYIIGIYVYRSVKDAHPTLMTSRGLPCGAKALMPRDRRAA